MGRRSWTKEETEEYARLRSELKQRREDYRRVAQNVFGSYVKVSDHANVVETEDGAFIEAVVWVPYTTMKEWIGANDNSEERSRSSSESTPPDGSDRSGEKQS